MKRAVSLRACLDKGQMFRLTEIFRTAHPLFRESTALYTNQVTDDSKSE